jgi:hypothetical protein
MSNSTAGQSLGEAVMMVRNLFGHSAEIGLGILSTLGQSSSDALCGVVQGRTPLGAFGGCDTCEIPPPCWLPQPLGQVTSFVAPGGVGTVRFRVTNCGFTARTITFATTKAIPAVTFSPASLTLAPLERGVVSASVQVAADAKQGSEHELVVLIHGCRNYYLRWVIKVAACGVDMCNEVEVDDCPDMIHHWYDHFYCPRHCLDQRQPGTPGGPGTTGAGPGRNT